MVPEGGPVLVARWQVPVVEVVIQGDLDAGSVAEAERVIGEAMRLRPRRLVVDLRRCRTVDTKGTILLVEARRRARAIGGSFVVHRPDVHRTPCHAPVMKSHDHCYEQRGCFPDRTFAERNACDHLTVADAGCHLMA